MKSPIAATLVALALAILVNVYYFTTSSDLTVVVSRTLFADMLLVLSLVPVYSAIHLRNSIVVLSMPERVKMGMKPVAMYTFLIAVVTFILFQMFGEPMVAERIAALEELLKTADISEADKLKQLEMARQIYSPTSHVLIVLLGNLFTGFVSSILAAVLVRK